MSNKWTENEIGIVKEFVTKNPNPPKVELTKLANKLNRSISGTKIKVKEIKKEIRYLKLDHTIDRQNSIGFDEVGVGSIAGPIVVAGVLLDPDHPISELKDSKKFGSFPKLKRIAEEIREKALWSLNIVIKPMEIGFETNTKKLSEFAIMQLINEIPREYANRVILIDGEDFMNQSNTFPGDDHFDFPVAAASIIAKSIQVAYMEDYNKVYPKYKLSQNHGYATLEHKKLIQRYGITKIHRIVPCKRIYNSR